MGGSRELGGYARERSLIKPLPLFRASTVGLPSRSARFITSISSISRGRQAEKAQKYPLRLHQHTMSQKSTSCWIRRCNRQYIFNSNDFMNFFTDKIDNIRNTITNVDSTASSTSASFIAPKEKLQCFRTIGQDELNK